MTSSAKKDITSKPRIEREISVIIAAVSDFVDNTYYDTMINLASCDPEKANSKKVFVQELASAMLWPGLDSGRESAVALRTALEPMFSMAREQFGLDWFQSTNSAEALASVLEQACCIVRAKVIAKGEAYDTVKVSNAISAGVIFSWAYDDPKLGAAAEQLTREVEKALPKLTFKPGPSPQG